MTLCETRVEGEGTSVSMRGSTDIATPLIVESARTLAETRRCLAATRRCIALSRRLLNPAWGISGAADVDPHLTVRERLERGALSLASKACAPPRGPGQS